MYEQFELPKNLQSLGSDFENLLEMPPESHASRHPALHASGAVIWNPVFLNFLRLKRLEGTLRNRLGQPKAN